MLGTEPRSSSRETSALKHQATSPAPRAPYLFNSSSIQSFLCLWNKNRICATHERNSHFSFLFRWCNEMQELPRRLTVRIIFSLPWQKSTATAQTRHQFAGMTYQVGETPSLSPWYPNTIATLFWTLCSEDVVICHAQRSHLHSSNHSLCYFLI